MVGLITSDELLDVEDRKEKPSTPLQTQTRLSSARKTPITSGQYSRQSGRWNETPKCTSRCRSSYRRTPLRTASSNNVFCVDEQEREMWVRIPLSYGTAYNKYCFLVHNNFLDDSNTMSNITN